MKKVKLKSQISGKSIDELFDYQTQDKINQYFTIDSNRTFYKNNNYLISKQLDLNETSNPIFFGNEYLFSIEKIYNNNEQQYYFVSKSNYPSLKLSYHNYRLTPNSKERELPSWISLYNFNYEINEIKDKFNIEQRRRKNKNLFLKNKKNNYELNIGDIIKLGRVSLILTKIHLEKTKKNNNNEGNDKNNCNKIVNDKSNNSNNNEIIKDIYQEYQLKFINNKIHIDKNLLKKFNSNNNHDQTSLNNNNDSNSLKGEFIFNNGENNENINDNKVLSDKIVRNYHEFINDESATSKIQTSNLNNNKQSNKTFDITKIKEKLNYNNTTNNDETLIENKSNSEKKNICRICYCDEEEIKSPLVNLCNCSGEIKYIHLTCLSHWLETKTKLLNFSNNICKQIIFNKINCEICKEKYPEIVFDLIKKKTYQVYKPEDFFSFIKNIYNNYIIFESFELINQKKIIYIISFDEKNVISLGRGQDCDARLGDVTVSRLHSLIVRTKENKIMIKDAGSKFGTLILLQAKKVLLNNKILSIQIGKLYLNLCVQLSNFNCIYKIFYFICRCFIKKEKKNNDKKLDRKSTNFSYNKSKSDYLNDSNYNMININNYINSNDILSLDYNNINMRNIIIEDIIDVKFQIDEHNIKNKYNKNNMINQLYNKMSNIDEVIKKNKSNIESFNNLNMI